MTFLYILRLCIGAPSRAKPDLLIASYDLHGGSDVTGGSEQRGGAGTVIRGADLLQVLAYALPCCPPPPPASPPLSCGAWIGMQQVIQQVNVA